MIKRQLLAFLLVTAILSDSARLLPPFRDDGPGCSPGPWEQLGIRVLHCDRERGDVVLALGDPRTARHVALIVPGVDADLRNLEHPVDPHRGPLAWARALRSAARSDDVAVVLWVGYRAPRAVGVDALFGRAARAGAVRLNRFLLRLRAQHRGPLHLSVIGHSYGAVVAATAHPASR
jgi:hypothetical protein